MKTNIHHNNHQPVLLETTIGLLTPKAGESYLDITAGYGGHASAVLARTENPDQTVLVDRDQAAVDFLRENLPAVRTIKSDFLQAVKNLQEEGATFDMILMDLGVSSLHFDRVERGFSFKADAPLDMRMDQSQSMTASILVNESSQEELERILQKYGEESRASAIAKAIISNRPISTTLELADLVEQTVKRNKRSKIHPATKTFQALRIAINDELGQLEQTLPRLTELLNGEGRVVAISFHSLEDRIVKRWLAQESKSGYEARLKVLTKKPILGQNEDVNNPRARSAKLRAAVKIKTERDTHAN